MGKNEAPFIHVDDETPLGRKYLHEADEFLCRAKPWPQSKKIFSPADWLEKVIGFCRWVDSLEETNPVMYYGVFFVLLAMGAEAVLISLVEGGWRIVGESLLETFTWW